MSSSQPEGSRWSRYEGPRGGTGWRNTATGEVRYQESKPTGGTDSAESPSSERRLRDAPRAGLERVRGSVRRAFNRWDNLDEIEQAAVAETALLLAVMGTAASTGDMPNQSQRQRTGDRGRSTDHGVNTEQDAAEVLGVSPDTDESSLRQAYRRRVMEEHPDRGGDTEEFIRVQDAAEVLGLKMVPSEDDRSFVETKAEMDTVAEAAPFDAEPLVKAWVRYRGPRGGEGWRNSETEEVRYQRDRPTGGGAGGDTAGAAPSRSTEYRPTDSGGGGGDPADDRMKRYEERLKETLEPLSEEQDHVPANVRDRSVYRTELGRGKTAVDFQMADDWGWIASGAIFDSEGNLEEGLLRSDKIQGFEDWPSNETRAFLEGRIDRTLNRIQPPDGVIIERTGVGGESNLYPHIQFRVRRGVHVTPEQFSDFVAEVKRELLAEDFTAGAPETDRTPGGEQARRDRPESPEEWAKHLREAGVQEESVEATERLISGLEGWGATNVHATPTGFGGETGPSVSLDFTTPMPGDQPIRSSATVEDGAVVRSTVRLGVLDMDNFEYHPTGNPRMVQRWKRVVSRADPPSNGLVVANFGDEHYPPRPHVLLGWDSGDVPGIESETVRHGPMRAPIEPDEYVAFTQRLARAARSEFGDQYEGEDGGMGGEENRRRDDRLAEVERGPAYATASQVLDGLGGWAEDIDVTSAYNTTIDFNTPFPRMNTPIKSSVVVSPDGTLKEATVRYGLLGQMPPLESVSDEQAEEYRSRLREAVESVSPPRAGFTVADFGMVEEDPRPHIKYRFSRDEDPDVDALMQFFQRAGTAIREEFRGEYGRDARSGNSTEKMTVSQKAETTGRGEWTPYRGPRGGEGWRHVSTGEVRYQKRRPDPVQSTSKPVERSETSLPFTPTPAESAERIAGWEPPSSENYTRDENEPSEEAHAVAKEWAQLGNIGGRGPRYNVQEWPDGRKAIDIRLDRMRNGMPSNIFLSPDGKVTGMRIRLPPLPLSKEYNEGGEKRAEVLGNARNVPTPEGVDISKMFVRGPNMSARTNMQKVPHIDFDIPEEGVEQAAVQEYVGNLVSQYMQDTVEDKASYSDAYADKSPEDYEYRRGEAHSVDDLPPGPDKRTAKQVMRGLTRADIPEAWVAETGGHVMLEFHNRDRDINYPSAISIDRDTGEITEVALRMGPLADEYAADEARWNELEGEWFNVVDSASTGLDLPIYGSSVDLGDRWVSDKARPHVRLWGGNRNEGETIDPAELTTFIERVNDRFVDQFGHYEDRLSNDDFADWSEEEEYAVRPDIKPEHPYFPEPREDVNRVLSASWLDDRLEEMNTEGGNGFTLNADLSEFGNVGNPESGHVATITGETFDPTQGEQLTKEDIIQLYYRYEELLERYPGRVKIGGWSPAKEQWGKSRNDYVSLDLNVWFPSDQKHLAEEVGRRFNQQAVFDARTFEDIPTDGTGEPTVAGESVYDAVADYVERSVWAAKTRTSDERANPGVNTDLPEEQKVSEEEPAEQKATTDATWQPYDGPRGGEGWRHTGTGEVRYQESRPR